jgi:DNA-binding response OmpR family regulator
MARRGILIVEDEILLGDDCASHVKEAGLEVIGPYSKLNDVPEDLTGIAGAILDINVAGRSAYRLIDRLLEMNVPVVFYTGYDVRHDPGKYAEIPRVPKPAACVYAVQELIRGLDV